MHCTHSRCTAHTGASNTELLLVEYCSLFINILYYNTCTSVCTHARCLQKVHTGSQYITNLIPTALIGNIETAIISIETLQIYTEKSWKVNKMLG